MGYWNIDSNAAANFANGKLAAADNDGGVIKAEGTFATTKFTQSDILSPSLFVTIVSGVGGVRYATDGTFNGGDQVIRNVTTDIAGTANTTLFGSPTNKIDSIHNKKVMKNYAYATAIVNNKWQEFSGKFDANYPEVLSSGAWDIAQNSDKASNLDTYTTDNAAHPTAAVPGEFAYRNGAATVVQANYAAKTIF
jgi:hypothetical protein